MSSAGATAGAAAAIAAAQAKKRREQEEEQMAVYNNEDLENYEFKFVRSSTGRFKNYEAVQKVCSEEAKAGWELLEKFDNNRLRFKRHKDKRAQDQYLDIDPYRTNVGIGPEQLGLAITLGVFLVVGVVLLGVYLLK